MTALSTKEVFRLESLEKITKRGQTTFVAVGNALAAIRDERLYLGDFDSFEEYCQETWGWSRQRGYQLIQAAEVVEALPPTLASQVVDERDARALSGLEPSEQKAVVREAKKEGVSITEKVKSLDPTVSTMVDINIIKLQARNDELSARLEQLEATLEDYEKLVADNEAMRKVLESTDRIKALLVANNNLREQVRVLEERVRGLQGERNAAIRQAKRAQ